MARMTNAMTRLGEVFRFSMISFPLIDPFAGYRELNGSQNNHRNAKYRGARAGVSHLAAVERLLPDIEYNRADAIAASAIRGKQVDLQKRLKRADHTGDNQIKRRRRKQWERDALKLLPRAGTVDLCRLIMEHTRRYYESIAKGLHEAGLYVSAVNPLLIKEYDNNSLHKVKTDKADAMKIARYALDNWCELRDYLNQYYHLKG